MHVSITLSVVCAFALMTATKIQSACPPLVHTIMTIVFENADYAKVLKDPYFGTTLPAKGYLLENMYGITHPSQGNYIAMIAGDTLGVKGDGVYNLDGNSIVDLLEANGNTWKTYQEDYPGNCATGSSYGGLGAYARKHNPFMSMKNIQTNPARCAKIVPATELDTDATGNNLPNYVFYTPNLKNDGHDTSITYASAWLKGFLEPKLTDPSYAKTLFFVTFDESRTYLGGNHIYSVLLGAGIVGANQTDATKYNHYSWLSTIEDFYGLGDLGRNDSTATKIPLIGIAASPIQAGC
ncbi:hypothetical protein HDU76_004546 [Blyttiomyces sp. JEL0837]|nr:hypothetical protein HDU76_004546 [Blyttiomyces sp. JEL0837]